MSIRSPVPPAGANWTEWHAARDAEVREAAIAQVEELACSWCAAFLGDRGGFANGHFQAAKEVLELACKLRGGKLMSELRGGA